MEEKIDLTKICKFIKKNYDELPKSNIEQKELIIFD